jgi:hypothetical protein
LSFVKILFHENRQAAPKRRALMLRNEVIAMKKIIFSLITVALLSACANNDSDISNAKETDYDYAVSEVETTTVAISEDTVILRFESPQTTADVSENTYPESTEPQLIPPEEVFGRFSDAEKSKLSYKAANVLYSDLYDSYTSSDRYRHYWWEVVSEHWKDDYDEVALVSLIDLNGDSFYEILFRKYEAGIGGEYGAYILYSAYDDKILVSDSLRGSYNLYRFENVFRLFICEQNPGDTVCRFFELSKNEYDNSGINDDWLLSVDYIDNSVKVVAYVNIDKIGGYENYYARYISGEGYYLYPEEYELNTRFKEDLARYQENLEDCSELLSQKEITLVKDDFLSFDSLIDALSPLDNY